MTRRNKCRFFNLAEQLSTNNAAVSSTVDSIVNQVVLDANVEERSDWEEIKKTLDRLHELNGPKADAQRETLIRKPKLASHRPGTLDLHNSNP